MRYPFLVRGTNMARQKRPLETQLDSTPAATSEQRAVAAGESDQASQSMVPLTLLLKPDYRNTYGRETVERLCQQLNLRIVSSSNVALCAQATVEQVKVQWGIEPQRNSQRPPESRDYGTPSGFNHSDELTVPAAWEEWVESIVIEPPAIRLR